MSKTIEPIPQTPPRPVKPKPNSADQMQNFQYLRDHDIHWPKGDEGPAR